MDINTLITQYNNGTTYVEDVLVDHNIDGTSVHLTFCGAYGQELCDVTISHAEYTCLKDEPIGAHFVTDF
jgi:hypothetical protein